MPFEAVSPRQAEKTSGPWHRLARLQVSFRLGDPHPPMSSMEKNLFPKSTSPAFMLKYVRSKPDGYIHHGSFCTNGPALGFLGRWSSEPTRQTRHMEGRMHSSPSSTSVSICGNASLTASLVTRRMVATKASASATVRVLPDTSRPGWDCITSATATAVLSSAMVNG